MNDKLDHIRSIIGELESELSSLDSVDPGTRPAMKEVVADIQSALGESGTGELSEKSLADRLQDAESQFEASHPTLSGILLRFVDALGQLGI